MILNKYDNEIYTVPFWKGKTIFQEPLTFIKEAGKDAKAKLLYCPKEIISVRSQNLETEYTEGEDYIVSKNEVIVTENSRINVLDESELYTEAKTFPSRDKQRFYKYLGGIILPKQIMVTYIHNDFWEGFVPRFSGDLLPKVTEKIKKKDKINITFVGDSITANGDISGSAGIKPFMPKYPEMLKEKLENVCGCKIEMNNFAIGGTVSRDFFANESVCNSAVNSQPNLLIIAYGMNDGSGWGVSTENFKQNIKRIADCVCENNPDCEVIAVSTIIPNIDACWEDGNPIYGFQDKYESALLELERQGFAIARMTSVYKYLENKKGFYSLTGNGINHPNDFVVRAYAQVLFEMLVK